MKKAVSILVVCIMMMAFVGCGKAVTPDYADAEALESALNADEDVTGKTVCFVVDEIKPKSTFGYNLISGEHLNFCSPKNPKVEVGDTVTVEITKVYSLLGSWIISYEMK